jgi:hypothetical protein
MFSFVGAISPEDLETALEDAFVMRDTATLRALFVDGAVVAVGSQTARGPEKIIRLISSVWESGRRHVTGTTRILQVGDLALVEASDATAVLQRGRDHHWRYAIWSTEER